MSLPVPAGTIPSGTPVRCHRLDRAVQRPVPAHGHDRSRSAGDRGLTLPLRLFSGTRSEHGAPYRIPEDLAEEMGMPSLTGRGVGQHRYAAHGGS